MTYTAPTAHDAPVTVTYELTKDEQRAAAFCHLFRNPRLYATPAVGAVSILLGLYAGLGLLVIAGLIDLLFVPVVILMTLRKLSALPGHVGPQTLAFSEWGVLVRSHRGEARVDWSAYSSAQETSRFYLLRTPSRSCVAIPKRAFASPLETGRFNSLLNRHTVCRPR